MIADGSNFAEENLNILYVDNVMSTVTPYDNVRRFSLPFSSMVGNHRGIPKPFGKHPPTGLWSVVYQLTAMPR